MKFSHFSLAFLLPIACSLSAMEKATGAEAASSQLTVPYERQSGLATITDRAGTLAQSTLVPAYLAMNEYKQSKEPVNAVIVFGVASFLNHAGQSLSEWLLDWPRSSRIEITPETEESASVEPNALLPRWATNGAKHAANQGIKIGMSVAPFAIAHWLFKKK